MSSGDYTSNLTAPDLRPYFQHVRWRVMGHSFGHEVGSDWADKSEDDPIFGIYKKCGLFTRDEAAILYTIAASIGGRWLDIGAHTGWTTAHLIAAGCKVVAVEPMLRLDHWLQRFEQNLDADCFWDGLEESTWLRSDEYMREMSRLDGPRVFDGVVIDGDHNHPCPLTDATLAATLVEPGRSVILLHDAIGGPVWRGIEHLMSAGYQCHMYMTPHLIACCYKGDWTPPKHEPDPAVPWAHIRANHLKDFPWIGVTYDADTTA